MPVAEFVFMEKSVSSEVGGGISADLRAGVSTLSGHTEV